MSTRESVEKWFVENGNSLDAVRKCSEPTVGMALYVTEQFNQFQFDSAQFEEMSQFECRVLSTNEFKKLLNKQNYQISYEEVAVGIYDGFTFVSPDDLEQEGNLYIVALEGDKMVGALKVKRYESKTHRYVSENEFLYPQYTPESKIIPRPKTYFGVRYIDVHKDYRRKGLSWILFSYFNIFLEQQMYQSSLNRNIDWSDSQPVRLSALTEEGKKARLLRLSRKCLPLQYVSMI